MEPDRTDRDRATYTPTAEAAWRWVLDQVRWDDGPWVPTVVPASEPPGRGAAPDDRDGLHSGIGGPAHVLAEIRLGRPWTEEESGLAAGIAARLRDTIATSVDCTYFDGLVSTIGALTALDAPGVDEAVARLLELAAPDGWPQQVVAPPSSLPGARLNDVTLGTGGVLLGALWARRCGVEATALATRAADVLLAEGESVNPGIRWRIVPLRFRGPGLEPPTDMPNWSHGTAGVAAALALAGRELDRPDLVDAARSGAEHLISLADRTGGGLLVPRYVPPIVGEDPVSFGWCHGAAGTSNLFVALDAAGVTEVAGAAPTEWHRRCLHTVRTSGIPERLRPGFWDNDGRCCGTAGVGDVLLDAWQRSGDEEALRFALGLADALVARAVVEGPHAYWRFVDHTAEEPLLPPGVGWMQGAAGIAGYLFRAGRLLRLGRDAPVAARLDTWWGVPGRGAVVD
ncbi:MAG: hypothetical protein JWO76_256 [Nocardioides sp.]|nr:hypothetical protein [Nocardioides sp.]